MAQQTVGIGSSANDGTGDPLRTAFTKINENFTELYAQTGMDTDKGIDINANTITSTSTNDEIIIDPNGTGKIELAHDVEIDNVDNEGDQYDRWVGKKVIFTGWNREKSNHFIKYNDKVLLVEDLITDGSSKYNFIKAVEEVGGRIKAIFVIFNLIFFAYSFICLMVVSPIALFGLLIILSNERSSWFWKTTFKYATQSLISDLS